MAAAKLKSDKKNVHEGKWEKKVSLYVAILTL